jgi:hypothetical protein
MWAFTALYLLEEANRQILFRRLLLNPLAARFRVLIRISSAEWGSICPWRTNLISLDVA